MGGTELVFEVGGGRHVRARMEGPDEGDPVVFHMGTPGARHLWERYVEELEARGLRSLCCSRAGYEGSDRNPGRIVADCVADTEAVLDQLGVERFYTVGISGGASYALASAALMPARVISSVAISGLAPRSALGDRWEDGMCRGNREEFAALREGPDRLERFIRNDLEGYGAIQTGADMMRAAREAEMPEPDLRALTGSYLDFQVRGCQRVAGDEPWGWLDDDYASWWEWGCDLTGIEVPVSLWFGDEDRYVPFAHGEWLAANVPGASAHLLPGEGHLSIFSDQLSEIVGEMVELGSK